MTDDIFARIRTAVTATPSSDDLQAVIRAVRAALSDEKAWRASFEETAINPLVDTSEAQRAQDEIAKSHLQERRLLEGLKLLEPKLAETAASEKQSALVEAYDTAKAERDAFVAMFRKTYPKHAAAIVDLLRHLVEIDDKIAGIATPAGFHRLDGVDDLLNADPKRSLVHHVRLPFVALTDAPAWDAEADVAAARLVSEQRERASAFASLTTQERRRA